jgi:phosphoglycolate phosphatase
MIKYVVFDFDGTIADTFGIIKEIAQREYSLTDEDFEIIREEGLWDLIKSPTVSLRNITKMAFIGIKSRMEDIVDIELFPDVVETIKILKKDYRLGIVSSNSSDIIFRTLKRNGIEDFFDFIYSDSSFFGKHLVLKRMCKKFGIKNNEVIYIGDEDRDIVASKKNMIKNIAVSWGFNSVDNLMREHPDFLVKNPKEILEKVFYFL